MDYRIRLVITEDEPFLWEMLYYAAHMDEGEEPLELAKTNPDLAPYVTNWGGTGDVGVIAIDSQTQAKVGAAWVRRMPYTFLVQKQSTSLGIRFTSSPASGRGRR